MPTPNLLADKWKFDSVLMAEVETQVDLSGQMEQTISEASGSFFCAAASCCASSPAQE